MAIRGRADANMVLSVLLMSLKPAVTKGGVQIAKVDLKYSSLTHVPIYGPKRGGLKYPVLKTKT